MHLKYMDQFSILSGHAELERAPTDLDRMYMDGGGTAGGSRGTDSCFFLGASLLSDVPCTGCDLAGYLCTIRVIFTRQLGCTSHWLQI